MSDGHIPDFYITGEPDDESSKESEMTTDNPKPHVFIEQEDGQLKPVQLSPVIALRAEEYHLLRKQNLSLSEIKFLYEMRVG
jgi:hypothetical protein